MKQVTDESKPEQWPELRELVDAAAMVAIFKIEAQDKLTYQVPAKAIDTLESAIRKFHPKVWEYVELERDRYLRYIQSKLALEGFEPIKVDGSDKADSTSGKRSSLSSIWHALGLHNKKT